ncbi:MAG: ATP-binding protein [Chitinophagaceae bacterium]
MRKLLTACVLLQLLTSPLTAQERGDDTFLLSTVTREGIILNQHWRFFPGDDTARAGSGSVSAGIPVDPTREIHHLPEVRKAGYGWFRLNLIVDPSLRGKSVALMLSGIGAMEIYLNGKIAYHYGKPSPEYNSEITRLFTNNLLVLTLDTNTRQVLEVRYSLNRKNLYVKFANDRPMFKMVLKEIHKGITVGLREKELDYTLRIIQVSFYLPLGFLLVFLFMSFRPQKEYLYAGIFCLSMFLAILFHILALSEPVTINFSDWFLLITQILYIVGAVSFIHSMHLLYKIRKTFLFYLIIVYGVSSIIYYFISYDNSGLYNAFFFPVINLEFLRLNIIAVARKRKGAGILLVTSIVFALTIISYIYFAFSGDNDPTVLFQGLSFIVPGLGLSIFYAGEFARTAVAERLRTVEVENLSREMLDREREKQQILTNQNETLEKMVAERTNELTRSLQDLKDAEDQLIQREKMASLGELTAGIAHEIQNPLNFVNNFSELNSELIDEMAGEIRANRNTEAEKLATDIHQNNEKITYHGKRADSIVKAMLQHSRNSSGLKEPVLLNNLVEECLRLSFHGMRAKDKTFNAKTEFHPDSQVGEIRVVSQDIGRVLLNLFTNAFYSVGKKRIAAGADYEPVVSARTTRVPGAVHIVIRDNGIGIPEKVMDKIYQPFFTTKPTGEGTGLGLSMSYDIITKGHGGELKVTSREGEFAEFIIILPE